MGRGLVLAVLASLLLAATAEAQVPYPLDCENMGASKPTAPATSTAMQQEVVEIPSTADGTALQIGFIRPKGVANAPVILHASPYHTRDLKDADIASCASWLAEFVKQGYAVALFPVRGGGDTDGCANMFGKLERQDLDDVLNYLGTRPWSNGNVGMIGISYSGSTPWVAASTGNPYLKTIVPEDGVSDLYELAFGAGTVDSRFGYFVPGYYVNYGAAEHNPVLSGRDPIRTLNSLTTCKDLGAGLTAQLESADTGARDKGGYWAERNQRPLVERNYRGSVLSVEGLTDWNVRPAHIIPWVASLRQHGIRVHQLLGQWNHEYPDTDGAHPRWDFADRMLAWFDHELKRDGSGSLGPRVEVEDDSGTWRRASRWPPPNTRTLRWQADNTLLAPDQRTRYFYLGQSAGQNNTDDDPAVSALADDACGDCARFSRPVKRELRIAGLPTVDVKVTPTGDQGIVTAFLYRKDSAGLHRVGWGMTDLRFPRGENSGVETAAPVVAGEPMRARIELEPLDAVLPKGSELVLVLGQGHTGQLPAKVPAPVTLASARLSFAVVHPSPGRFFTPPGPDGRRL